MLNFNLFSLFTGAKKDICPLCPGRTIPIWFIHVRFTCIVYCLYTTKPNLSSITFIYKKKGLFMQIHATMLHYISSYRTYRQISHNWPLQNFQSHLKILSTFFFTLVLRLVSFDSDLLFKIKFLFSLHWKLSQINLKYIK